MKVYVGITDDRWAAFLAERPSIDEVNFWRPGGAREFRALTPGEPFFFKTHRARPGRAHRLPPDRIVGGGFFSGFASLRVSEAWEMFGVGNGVDSPQLLRELIGSYRQIEPWDDPFIGCVLIRDVSFFPSSESVEPREIPSNVVQGKTFDLAEDPSLGSYFSNLIGMLVGGGILNLDITESWSRPGPVYGDPRLAPRRLGQQAFQAVVLGAYHRRCAVTGDRIRPVLQAAHIRPLPDGGEHRLDNGLLLRSDVHTLYDRGYLGVDPAHRLLVSPRLRDEFGNGEEFYARARSQIHLPDRRTDRPSREFLEWHLDEVFKAS